MEIVGLFMAGWGSNNKYALLSAMRAVNQIIAYDLPFIFSALVPVLLAGSLKLSDIAAAVFHCLVGDLVIASVALTLALALFGTPAWPHERFWTVGTALILGGVGYTI